MDIEAVVGRVSRPSGAPRVGRKLPTSTAIYSTSTSSTSYLLLHLIETVSQSAIFLAHFIYLIFFLWITRHPKNTLDIVLCKIANSPSSIIRSESGRPCPPQKLFFLRSVNFVASLILCSDGADRGLSSHNLCSGRWMR